MLLGTGPPCLIGHFTHGFSSNFAEPVPGINCSAHWIWFMSLGREGFEQGTGRRAIVKNAASWLMRGPLRWEMHVPQNLMRWARSTSSEESACCRASNLEFTCSWHHSNLYKMPGKVAHPQFLNFGSPFRDRDQAQARLHRAALG